MGKNHFNEKQQAELGENPYVKKVSAKSITYTKEFKEAFEVEYRLGKPPIKIFTDMGFDYQMLGKRRRDGIVARMKKYELRSEGTEDQRKNNPGRPSTKHLSDEEKIKRLEQKIAYLNQENEFLKKNIQVDRQANWEYKRNHTSNSNSSKK